MERLSVCDDQVSETVVHLAWAVVLCEPDCLEETAAATSSQAKVAGEMAVGPQAVWMPGLNEDEAETEA